jgi:adenylate kinase
MNLILIGPQGSGKGTQAELLNEKLNIPIISVGRLLRRQIRKETDLGKKIEKYVTKGDLVPNKITNQVVKHELGKLKYKKGAIFDGYPRDLGQTIFLERLIKIDYLILIKISKAETIKRLSGRRVCLSCGENYHILYKKPQNDMICDECGKKLIRRKDDNPAAIKARLKIYNQETKPIIDYFDKQGKVIKINGEQTIKRVLKDILKALKNKGLVNDNL